MELRAESGRALAASAGATHSMREALILFANRAPARSTPI